MVIKKITSGFVIQEFDTDQQAFVSQEFIAGDDVDYELDDEPIDEFEFDEHLTNHTGYCPYDMVQPTLMR